MAFARDERLQTVERLFETDPGNELSLVELASAAHCGTRTLTRAFRAEYGMTFPQWRTQVRLFHALILLGSGATVTRAGQTCGWATTSNFIDVFRRVFGYTPGDYQARMEVE